MTLQEIIPRFKSVRKNGAGYTALCPAHDDQQPSLSITESDGKILMKCHSGCDVQSIVSKLGIELKDLFTETKLTKKTSNSQSKKIVAVYPYTDENGDLLYENVRFEPKGFSQRKPNGAGGYDYSLNGTRRVPYRLSELIKAVEDPLNLEHGATVWLCEGEDDADNLRSLGFTTSNFKNWQPEFNSLLKSAHICILQDHDKAGLKQAADVAKILYGNVASLKVIDLFSAEPIPEKHGKDVSDFIKTSAEDKNLSAEEIAESLCVLADHTDVWQPNEEDKSSIEAEGFADTPIEVKPFPQPNEKCFYGLAGDFVRLIEPHTEADKMALLIQFLIYFGNIIGRSAYFLVEDNRHYTNLFGVLVGDTANGRKGTSLGRVKGGYKGIDEAHEKECIVSGLASGEGLLYHVRDPVITTNKNGETVVSDPGVSDKRLLITEGEFANVLRVQGREGNTLSAFLRNLWDDGNARSLTKNSPLRTTDAHVSIAGHITKAELLTCLSEVESANGYANRFLWVCVNRSQLLPFGSKIDPIDLLSIKADISRRIEFAQTVGQIQFSDEAKELWASSYEHLETSRFGFVAKVTQRASPYVLRLSCVFALLDGHNEIKREHLEAGLAVWQYCEDSAKYIFGERLGDKNADQLLDALRKAKNGLTRSEIYTDVFQKNLPAKEIRNALQVLVDSNLIECKMELAVNAKKLSERWFAKSSVLRI